MAKKSLGQWNEYHIMQGSCKVARISRNGICRIVDEKRMPYNLYLEEGSDLDVQLQNLENFYHWCASRVLTLDRQYAKEILNSIGASQSMTDRSRAEIALSYHCLSLMDIFWVKEADEGVSFQDINLFENHPDSAFIDVALRGRQMTVENRHLVADDLSTQGCFPKAWVRQNGTFYLLKDGGEEAVANELLASRICRCFQCNQVVYEQEVFDGQQVSASKIITSLEKAIVPMEHFEIYAANQEIDKMEYILELDGYSFYMMNILDYLIGNTDRHWGNWGFLVDNHTNQPVRLYDLMDFNRAFQSYDTVEGAVCLTTGRREAQLAAAVKAVGAIGLNQIAPVQREWFMDDKKFEMFQKRLEKLKLASNTRKQ